MAYKGNFRPKNKEKYIGDCSNIVYRSLWERQLMVKFDENPNYLEWSSESIIVPYISPVDNRMHRYFPDFFVKFIDKDDKIVEMMIEVKPHAQTVEPKQPKTNHYKRKARYIRECATYAVNQAKWKAAQHYCDVKGYEFKILTEKEIKPQYKKRKKKTK